MARKNGSVAAKNRVILPPAKTGTISRIEARNAVTRVMHRNDRIVYRRADGKWVNKRGDSSRASSVHTTQGEAVRAARDILRNRGGGRLAVQGKDGRIRGGETVPA